MITFCFSNNYVLAKDNKKHDDKKHDDKKQEVTNKVNKGHAFPTGYCTAYAANMFSSRSGKAVCWNGDAGEWIANAGNSSFNTSSNPNAARQGAIISWKGGRYGHVGYVEKVNGNKITVSEMNWGQHMDKDGKTDMWNKVNTVTLSVSNLDRGSYAFKGYIYP